MGNVVSIATRRDPHIILHAEDGLGEILVQVIGAPALIGAADRRFPDTWEACEYALDLQDLHGWAILSDRGDAA